MDVQTNIWPPSAIERFHVCFFAHRLLVSFSIHPRQRVTTPGTYSRPRVSLEGPTQARVSPLGLTQHLDKSCSTLKAQTHVLKWDLLDLSRNYPSLARDLFQADARSEFQTFLSVRGCVTSERFATYAQTSR